MAGDAHWSNVSLLLDCEGADGGTTFTDSSSQHSVPADVVGATTVTAEKVFGNSSLKIVSGSTHKLRFAGSAALTMPGDFTVEMFCKLSSRTNVNFFSFGENEAPGRALVFTDSDKVAFNLYADSILYFSGSTTSFPLNTWFHLAIVRSGSTITCYVDGSSIGTVTSGATLGNGTGGFMLYSNSVDQYWDVVRVTKGYARSIAVPTESYPHGAALVEGTVTDSAGDPAARVVRAYDRDTGALVGETTSDGTTGAYVLWTSTSDEVTVLALDDATSGTIYNDTCQRVIPAT